MKLLETLEKQLKKEPNFFSDNGELKKWVVLSKAQNMDEELIELLLENEELKAKFFIKIKDSFVFNLPLFSQFLEQKNYLNDSYTTYKNKIGLTIDGKYLKQRNEVALVWPFKDCVLEGGQNKEEQKREEIFFNEILAQDEITQLLEPKVLTAAKKFSKDGEEEFNGFTRDESGTIKDNLIIKGNNLLALHSLKKEFAGKVKLIYIDPPYNTGSDSFKYNDNFNHSTWLTFIKNRLDAAKDLLRDDGIIFVQCDDSEQAYLKILMDQIFENGFLNCIAVKMSEASGVKMNHALSRFPKIKEYLLVYHKGGFEKFAEIDKYKQDLWDKENNIFLENFTKEQRDEISKLEEKSENDEFDVNRATEILKNVKKVSLVEKIKSLEITSYEDLERWKFEHSYQIIKTAGSASLARLVRDFPTLPNQDIGVALSSDKVMFFYITDFNRETKQPRLQVIFADSNIFKNPCDFWQDIKTTGAIADEGGVKMGNGKKPEKLLHRIIKMTTKEGDLVLDFFSGSGTTPSVSHKMNRRWIAVEQMDYIKDLPEQRLKNVIAGDKTGISDLVGWKGGGEFIYLELKKHNQAFIDKIEVAKNTNELLKIWVEMKERSFLNYNVDIKKQDEHLEDFKALSLEEQKKHLVEILDKNQLYVNLSSLENKDFACSKEEKQITKDFYQIKN